MRACVQRCVRLAALVAAMTVAVWVPTASATPIAAVDYIETTLAGGLFRYDYTLRNEGDPSADAGYDAYDLALFFSPAVSLVSSVIPTGWDLIAGLGFIDTFSVAPGIAPAGVDIGPGQFSTFSFVFDNRLASSPFEVVLSNPADMANPLVLSGFATPAQEIPSVPEPAAFLLFGSGVVGLAFVRRHVPRVVR